VVGEASRFPPGNWARAKHTLRSDRWPPELVVLRDEVEAFLSQTLADEGDPDDDLRVFWQRIKISLLLSICRFLTLFEFLLNRRGFPFRSFSSFGGFGLVGDLLGRPFSHILRIHRSTGALWVRPGLCRVTC